MRLAGIRSIASGEVLAIPVCASSGRIILNAGVALTDGYIDKIKNLGINKVYIEDGRFLDVQYSEVLNLKIRNDAVRVVREAYANLHKDKAVDEYVIKGIAQSIVDDVRENKDKGVSMLGITAVDDYIAEHSVNAAILAAFIGNRMSFNYTQLCDLVTGALIHDLGRENAPVEKPEHVQKGFDTMRKCRGLSLHSSIVCYEHHENFDGSGYPRKLKGTAISEFSRVIRVADIYDTCLYGYESNNESVMPHQAYEYLLAAAGEVVDPSVVEVFRDAIVFYPNGCTVLLSNGLKGIVVRQNMGSPQRPVVRVFNDNAVIGEIDLIKSLTMFIREVTVI